MLNEFRRYFVEDVHAMKISAFSPRGALMLSRIGIKHENLRCRYPHLYSDASEPGYMLRDQLTDDLTRIETVHFPIATSWDGPCIRIEKQLALDIPIMRYVAALGPKNALNIDLFSMNKDELICSRLQRHESTGPFQLVGNEDQCVKWGIRQDELTNTPSDEIFRRIITNELFNLKKIDDGIYTYSM